MASVGDRLNDPEYRNWIRATLCLQFIKDGLVTFAEQKSNELFQKVIPQLGQQGITTANDLCGAFIFNKRTKKYSCCNGCDVFVNELNQYLHGVQKLNLNNSDTNCLLQDHWQLAKFYMNVGQDKANSDPNNTDVSGVLNFLDHCNIPRQGFTYPGNLKKVRDARNHLIHSANQKVTENDFQTDIVPLFIDLLEDPANLVYNQEAKLAVERIKEIKADDFVITKESEKKALEELVKEIQQMMAQAIQTEESSQSTSEEVKKAYEEIQKLLERLKPYEELDESLRAVQEDFSARFRLLCQEQKEMKKEQKEMKKDIEYLKKGIQESDTPSEDDLQILAQYLKDGYDSYLKTRVLHGGYKISVGEIFSPVILTYSKIELSSYKDMLCGAQKKQFFLKGEAGSGKTTFCKHLIDVWRTKSGTLQFQDPVALRQFTFVFHVSFRFAKATESILEMICEQLLDDESKKRVTKYVLQYCPEKCFIIADGLDEWQCSPEKVSGWRRDIPGLPSRKGVEDCLILITSRPWRLQALTEKIEPKSIFELDGLQTPELLIKNILSKMKDPQPAISCNKFLDQVKRCGLKQMMKTPLVLIIMLSIWGKDKSLHPSVSQNYISTIQSLILRADDEQHWTGNERRLMEPLIKNPEYWKQKWEKKSGSLPLCCQKLKPFKTFAGLIISLSHLAFDLLFRESAEQKLVFSEKDYEGYLCEEELNVCLGIGILSKFQTPRGIDKLESYSFPHKSIQEFLAAVWLAGPDGADSVGRIKEQIRNKGVLRTVLGDLWLLIKFLCGLAPQIGADIFIYSYKHYTLYLYNLRDFVLNCSVESQHCNNTTHVYPTLPGIIVVHQYSISMDEFRMLTDILKSPSSGLRWLDIDHLSLDHSSIDLLYQSLSCCDNLEYLWLERISCSDDSSDNISPVLDLQNLHKLEKLRLWKLSFPTVLLPQVTNSCLRELYIRYCNNISPVLDLQNLPKLEKLTLWSSSVPTVLWPQVTNSCLRELYIQDCNNISPVLDLQNLPKLEKLRLWFLSVPTVLWPQVTNSCLRELDIVHLNLTHECVEELCRTYEQYRQSEMERWQVKHISCVDHRTLCDSFEDLQRHIMSVNLPHSDDDDNNVCNDNVDNNSDVDRNEDPLHIYVNLPHSDNGDNNVDNDNVDTDGDLSISSQLYEHILMMDLPHSNDGDYNVDNDNVENNGNNHQNQDSAEDSCCCSFCTHCTLF